MRTTTDAQTGITLNYPDALAFAFNPVLITATGADSLSVGIFVGGVRVYYAEVAAFSSACYIDMQEYVQSLFESMTLSIDYSQTMALTSQGSGISFQVQAVSGADTYDFTFSSFIVWGAVIPDGRDDFRRLRRVVWFKNYPFVFGLYASANTSVLFGVENAPQTAQVIPYEGIYNFGTDNLAAGAKYYVIYEYEGTIQQSVFDDYFDLTFYLQQNVSQTPLLRIDVEDTADEGIYLRWIDRHGYWAHWLFKVGDEQHVVSAVREYSRNAMLSYDQTYGYQRGAGRRQSMTRADIVPLCAPLVDKDTFDYLQDVTSSPVVDMFAGYDANNEPQWVGVGVQAATYTKKRDELQDFVFNLLTPEIPIQSL